MVVYQQMARCRTKKSRHGIGERSFEGDSTFSYKLLYLAAGAILGFFSASFAICQFELAFAPCFSFTRSLRVRIFWVSLNTISSFGFFSSCTFPGRCYGKSSASIFFSYESRQVWLLRMKPNSTGGLARSPAGWLWMAASCTYWRQASVVKVGKRAVTVYTSGNCRWISLFLKKLSSTTNNFRIKTPCSFRLRQRGPSWPKDSTSYRRCSWWSLSTLQIALGDSLAAGSGCDSLMRSSCRMISSTSELTSCSFTPAQLPRATPHYIPPHVPPASGSPTAAPPAEYHCTTQRSASACPSPPAAPSTALPAASPPPPIRPPWQPAAQKQRIAAPLDRAGWGGRAFGSRHATRPGSCGSPPWSGKQPHWQLRERAWRRGRPGGSPFLLPTRSYPTGSAVLSAPLRGRCTCWPAGWPRGSPPPPGRWDEPGRCAASAAGAE